MSAQEQKFIETQIPSSAIRGCLDCGIEFVVYIIPLVDSTKLLLAFAQRCPICGKEIEK